MSRKQLISLSTVVVLTSISIYFWISRPIDISTLGGKLIQYNDLPPIVADIFLHTDNYPKAKDQNLIATDSIRQYELEVVETGPWTDYFLIVIDGKKRFKVPKEKTFPFVIHKGELFIPTEYNLSNSAKASKAVYERYTLPD